MGRRRSFAVSALGTYALLMPVVGAAAAIRADTSASARKTTVTRTFDGINAIAGQWGSVQIDITRKTATGGHARYTNLGGSYSYHTSRSQYIMSQALPILRQEFLSAQSANIQMVSGATFTSQAFMQSLQSALLKAGK